MNHAMSSRRCQGGVDEVPMEIGRSFYPLPIITVPNVDIPELSLPHYDFCVERKAIDEYRSNCKRSENTIQRSAAPLATSASPESVPHKTSSAILEPSPAVSNTLNKTCNNDPKRLEIKLFEEFEAMSSPFDQLEIHTIDDRTALEQVLGSSSNLSQTQKPQSTTCSAQCRHLSNNILPSSTRDSVFQLTSSILSHSLPSFSSIPKDVAPSSQNNIVPSKWVPNKPVQSSAVVEYRGREILNVSPSKDEIVRKLIAKGYSEQLVQQCYDMLPQNLRALTEYYTKSMLRISKQGVNPKSALDALLSLNLSDKKRVLSFSEAFTQLHGLGFDAHAVLDALCVCDASRDAALDRLLATNSGGHHQTALNR